VNLLRTVSIFLMLILADGLQRALTDGAFDSATRLRTIRVYVSICLLFNHAQSGSTKDGHKKITVNHRHGRQRASAIRPTLH